MRPTPLCLLLAVAGVASAQDGAKLSGPEVVRARGITTLTFRGRLVDQAGRSLVARIARGKRSALAAPLRVDPQGACELNLRTARLLQPGDYVLELAPVADGPALLRQPFRLGDAGEAAAARKRLLAWYRGASATFRELASTLERRGRFYHALAQADPKRQAELEERMDEGFLSTWSRALRMARMDLATYQRRLILPAEPEAGDALLRLVDLLSARAEAWLEALQPFGKAPADEPAISEAAAALLAAIGEDAALLEHWKPGPLAVPRPSDPVAGEAWVDPVGYRLDIPEGAKVQPQTDPRERISLGLEGLSVSVEVSPLPLERTPEALVERLEVDAWERWDSYKRRTSEALEGGRGLRLEFRARYLGHDVDVVQLSLFPSGGGRAISLYVFRAAGAPWPEEGEALLDTFALEPK